MSPEEIANQIIGKSFYRGESSERRLLEMLREPFKEIDRLRDENEKLSDILLKFGGKNAGQIWGLTNCSACKNLDNDYYFIGKKTLCQKCFDSFPESFNKEHDQLLERVKLLRQALETLHRNTDNIWEGRISGEALARDDENSK